MAPAVCVKLINHNVALRAPLKRPVRVFPALSHKTTHLPPQNAPESHTEIFSTMHDYAPH